MDKTRTLAAIRNCVASLLFLFLCCNTCVSQTRIEQVYLSQVGVREATGRNDGKEVEKYLRSVGLGKGYAWCAAFVHWCLNEADVKNNITAWSPTAHNAQNVVWNGKRFIKEPQPGDVFTLYFPSLKRIAHTGFYHRTVNASVYETVEGNTNSEGSREGDGVYKKKRSFNSTHSITRHKN